MNIATKIRRLREAAGMNQQQLAALAHVSQGRVSRWEKGASPQSHHVHILAKIFGKSVDELVGLDSLRIGTKVRVMGCVEAGVFRETNEFAGDDVYDVTIPSPKN